MWSTSICVDAGRLTAQPPAMPHRVNWPAPNRPFTSARSWPGPGVRDRQLTCGPPRTAGLEQGDRNREYQQSTTAVIRLTRLGAGYLTFISSSSAPALSNSTGAPMAKARRLLGSDGGSAPRSHGRVPPLHWSRSTNSRLTEVGAEYTAAPVRRIRRAGFRMSYGACKLVSDFLGNEHPPVRGQESPRQPCLWRNLSSASAP
jgi:hypothetical protein